MNQPVLIFVGIAAVLFIILLILRNKKDKKWNTGLDDGFHYKKKGVINLH